MTGVVPSICLKSQVSYLPFLPLHPPIHVWTLWVRVGLLSPDWERESGRLHGEAIWSVGFFVVKHSKLILYGVCVRESVCVSVCAAVGAFSF